MRIGIDIGGTFTDFVLFDPASGALQTFKRLSTPHDPAEAVLAGLSDISDQSTVHSEQPEGDMRLFTVHRSLVTEIVHGSTVATNALLERRGAATALVSTAGFRDVLAIGRQNRSQLYDFFADRPEPLAPAELRLEVAERVDRHGNVLLPLDPAELALLVEWLRQSGVQSVAVCLLFSFANPAHERHIAPPGRSAGLPVQRDFAGVP
jgi:N-methylhydantoinase A